MKPMGRAAPRSGLLEYRYHAHAARGAHRDQATPGARRLGQLLRELRHDARAGGREWMAHRDARAVHVELRAVDAAERLVEAEAFLAVLGRFPRPERAQHLRGESFVDFVEIEVLQR